MLIQRRLLNKIYLLIGICGKKLSEYTKYVFGFFNEGNENQVNSFENRTRREKCFVRNADQNIGKDTLCVSIAKSILLNH